GERANELGLDISRQAHGEPVHVDLPGVDPLWLEEDLVTLLLGESRNLVLERRAIARADPANLTVVERRPSEIRTDQLVHAISRVQEMALDLRPVDRAGHERKRNGRLVASLDHESAALDLACEVYALAIEPRRSARLQSTPLEAERLQRFREHL